MTAKPPSRQNDLPREPSERVDTRADEAPVLDASSLSDEEKMLLALRDELYEGRWDLFERDLKARLNGEPHVFEIGPVSDRLRETIEGHLRIMNALRARNV